MLIIPLSANAQTPQSHIILINDMSSGNEEICASFNPQTCYTPSEITINVGDSVTWVNNNPSPDWYTLVGDWGGLSQGSGNDNACDGNGKLGYDMCGVSGNDRISWTHTFDTVGTFNYHDWIYQNSAQRPEGVVNVVVEPFAPEPVIQERVVLENTIVEYSQPTTIQVPTVEIITDKEVLDLRLRILQVLESIFRIVLE
tara:strand:- start:14 stop:610 length:597 start_codon:yes stop_codon:yes gene_type:complete